MAMQGSQFIGITRQLPLIPQAIQNVLSAELVDPEPVTEWLMALGYEQEDIHPFQEPLTDTSYPNNTVDESLFLSKYNKRIYDRMVELYGAAFHS
jgi:hypothetical protein